MYNSQCKLFVNYDGQNSIHLTKNSTSYNRLDTFLLQPMWASGHNISGGCKSQLDLLQSLRVLWNCFSITSMMKCVFKIKNQPLYWFWVTGSTSKCDLLVLIYLINPCLQEDIMLVISHVCFDHQTSSCFALQYNEGISLISELCMKYSSLCMDP